MFGRFVAFTGCHISSTHGNCIHRTIAKVTQHQNYFSPLTQVTEFKKNMSDVEKEYLLSSKKNKEKMVTKGTIKLDEF